MAFRVISQIGGFQTSISSLRGKSERCQLLVVSNDFRSVLSLPILGLSGDDTDAVRHKGKIPC